MTTKRKVLREMALTLLVCIMAVFATYCAKSDGQAAGGDTGGGSGGSGGGGVTRTIGGTITGLTGTLGLKLNSEAAQNFTSNGSYTLSATVADGASYTVAVDSHPLTQFCYLANATGTATSNITNVNADCKNSLISNSSFEGPSSTGWTITGTGAAVTPTGYSANDGSAVFEFTALTTNFGGSKVDICIPIDKTKDLNISFKYRSNTGTATSDVRLGRSGTGSGFFSEATCTTAATGVTTDFTIDYDIMDVTSGSWATATKNITAAGASSNATHFLISLRARDNGTACSILSSSGGCMAFDNVIVTQP